MTKPNVLFITVDQWPAHLLGCAGNETIETPTLDALAAAGTRYECCYSLTPICIPARRSIMTGTTSRGHGDREFQPALPMPCGITTLASAFSQADYQCMATGKLHVYPPRDRIGFDDAMLAEEGRSHLGGPDDYEIFLADKGHVGEQYMHCMSNNEYGWANWHLSDDLHVTNWTTKTAARQIKRRDPTRPAFWHVSYTHPHPPLAPLSSYFDRYARREMPQPVTSDWSDPDSEAVPYLLKATRQYYANISGVQLDDTRRAFYALCTHIDHQIRLLIGTLREEGVLDNTIIVFTSDHGDMLGDHGIFGKRVMYDASARVPLIIVDTVSSARARSGCVDNRLVGLHDLMPTMLDLAGIDIPDSVEGCSIYSPEKPGYLYGESNVGVRASRMIRDVRYKLIWYPAGNRFQLFDMLSDPLEQQDLGSSEEHAQVLSDLKSRLLGELYGEDLQLLDGQSFDGLPEPALSASDNRGLSGQRGVHFPPLAMTNPETAVGSW